MNIKWISVPALALCIGLPGAAKAVAHAQPLHSAQYQDRDRDQDRWGEPPNDYRDAQRQGFHEGMEAARRDMQNGHRRDADDHQMYKHPPVDGDEARRDFREGFKEGYRRAVEHMRNDRNDDRDRDRPYEQPHM